MTPVHTLWAMIACFLVSTVSLLAVTEVRCWRRRRRTDRAPDRAPVSEKLLRPAGESLRLKIDELNDKHGEALALAMIVPGVVAAAVLVSSSDGSVSHNRAILAFVVCVALVVVMARRAFTIVMELRKYRQGFHAERAVAEELNQLMRDGCWVFHDVPIAPYGNIDHVIVSPAGVFAVETKSCQKYPAAKGKGKPYHKATFDGEGVNFPTWRDVGMVSQAKMEGDRLRSFLTSAVGEPVDVLAILTLPGWWLESSVPPGAVRVLNPKVIKSVVTDARSARLSPEMIQRIAHQLEQKCRDVEL